MLAAELLPLFIFIFIALAASISVNADEHVNGLSTRSASACGLNDEACIGILRAALNAREFRSWLDANISDGNRTGEDLALIGQEVVKDERKILPNYEMWDLAQRFNLTHPKRRLEKDEVACRSVAAAGRVGFLLKACSKPTRSTWKEGGVPTSTSTVPILSIPVHLVRVPKSASSSASALARRLAGCHPRGPCCDFPGDPPGSCPARGLNCRKVQGCSGHASLGLGVGPYRDNTLLMTFLRNPLTRAISAFFYPAHHPKCEHSNLKALGTCFEKFLVSDYSTPLENQLTGHRVYGHRAESREGLVELAKKRLREAFEFIGIVEVFDLSVVSLFAKVRRIGPITLEDLTPLGKGNRKNAGFYTTQIQYLKAQYTSTMEEILRPEKEVYHEALRIFCRDLKFSGLWHSPATRKEVQNKSAGLFETCAQENSSSAEQSLPSVHVNARGEGLAKHVPTGSHLSKEQNRSLPSMGKDLGTTGSKTKNSSQDQRSIAQQKKNRGKKQAEVAKARQSRSTVGAGKQKATTRGARAKKKRILPGRLPSASSSSMFPRSRKIRNRRARSEDPSIGDSWRQMMEPDSEEHRQDPPKRKGLIKRGAGKAPLRRSQMKHGSSPRKRAAPGSGRRLASAGEGGEAQKNPGAGAGAGAQKPWWGRMRRIMQREAAPETTP